MRKRIITLTKIIFGLYIILCTVVYFIQEDLIFFPEKLDKNFEFEFNGVYEELTFTTNDGVKLNGLLFKSTQSKGLIFYLHGNAGSLNTSALIAKTYTGLGYDIFMIDYRGFGKSEGDISEQAQLFSDNQIVYDELKKSYKEEDILILGYSIGTGMATKLASMNKPKRLILQAPYYSLVDMMKKKYPYIPTFILKYRFETKEYLKKCDMPITIFHGKQDQVIYHGSSVKLMADFDKINLFTLKNQDHFYITRNEQYLLELKKILQ